MNIDCSWRTLNKTGTLFVLK